MRLALPCLSSAGVCVELPERWSSRLQTGSDRHILRTLPLSGRQGACGGDAESCWGPLHSRGLFEV